MLSAVVLLCALASSVAGHASVEYEVTVRTYFFIPQSGDPACYTVKPPTVEATEEEPVKGFLTGPDSCGDNMFIANLTVHHHNETWVNVSGQAEGFTNSGWGLVELGLKDWTLTIPHKPAPVTVIGGLYTMIKRKELDEFEMKKRPRDLEEKENFHHP